MSVSFDSSPTAYFLIGNMLIFIIGVFSFTPFIRPSLAEQRNFLWVYVLLSIFMMVMMRMPVIIYNHELNPDESWLIVGAMTLADDPIFWESVDGGTSGPLNFYPLVIFCEVFNQPYDYISGRMLGILLMIGSVIFFFFSILKLYSTKIAYLSLFPIVTFLGTTRLDDYVHFSSEHTSIFLIAFITYIYATLSVQAKPNKNLIFVFGVVACATVFAKLQSAPITFFCFLLSLKLLHKKTFLKSHTEFFRQAFVLILGSLSVLIIIAIYAFYHGVLDNIITFYFINNLKYQNTDNIFFDFGVFFSSIFDNHNIFARLILSLTVLSAVFYWLSKQKFQFIFRPSTALVLTMVVSSIFAAYKTGFIFYHYLLYLVFPTGLLYALLLNNVLKIKNQRAVLLFLGLFTAIILIKNTLHPLTNKYITDNVGRQILLSEVSLEIQRYVKPDEGIVVWGTAGNYYIENQFKQGVPWNNTLWGLYADSTRHFLYKNFVESLRKSPAPVFIDSHKIDAPILRRDKAGYETVEELKNYIDSNYIFVKEIDQHRIFIRKDRVIIKNSSHILNNNINIA